MLMSAVLDPSALGAEYLDELYTIQAEDFLHGIWKNGVLIVDSERRLQDALSIKVELLPIKSRRLQTLLTDLLKEKSKRVAVPSASLSNASSADADLLDLAYHLKIGTEANILIVGDKNFEELRFNPKYGNHIFPLSEYRDSDFEADRQRYENQLGPIDKLSKSTVEDIIVRSIRFTKWLRFYDAYIGSGENTSRFRRSIEYILTLWKKHSFFASRQNIGPIEIFTCNAEQIRDNETDQAKKSKLERNQENHRKVIRELIDPLNEDFPWPIKLFVKDDSDGIFHARYLETQHAIIRIDRGFDLFKQNNEFRRNFFTLNMAESSHLKECRDLRNVVL